MDVCRACLASAEYVVPIDDNFINGYNLLTNLNIKPLDGLSQYVCQMCVNTVNYFVNFREQCIASEDTLQKQFLQIVKSDCEIDETSHQNTSEAKIKKSESIGKHLVKKRVGRPRKESTDKILVKRRVGRPRKTTSNNGSGNTTTEPTVKRGVGRPRKNVATMEINNGTWVVRPRSHITTIEKASNKCVGQSIKNSKTTKSQKWVVCPRKYTSQNNESKNSYVEIPSQNILNEKKNVLHGFELSTPSDKVIKSGDLAIKEEIESPDDNSVSDNLDTIGYPDLEVDLVKTEDLEDIVETAENKKEKTPIQCDAVKSVKLNAVKSVKIPKDNKEEPSFPCGLCKKKLENQESLSSHLDSHRSCTRCEVCEETFPEWQALLAHRLRHVKSRKHHNCHICLKPQRSVVNFEYHYLSVHSDKDIQDITMTCRMCSKKYSDPIKLSKHIKYYHKELRYTCDNCSKAFSHKFSLVKHMRRHYDDKPFACDICGYASKFNSGLKLRRHMPSHSDVRKYSCKRCPATFKRKMTLQVHTDKHDDLRPHRCEFCPMRFNSPNVLTKHRRVHTGEKPYVCKVCSKGFTANHNLKVHMRVHGEDLVVKRNASQPQDNIHFVGT